MKLLTTNRGHGLVAGDVLHTSDMTFKRLLLRPRITYVVEPAETVLMCDERRMSWGEWLSAIWERIAR